MTRITEPRSTISAERALTVAQGEAARVYRDLAPYRIRLSLEDDGWHVDYELKDPRLTGGGPHFVIDAINGTILQKRFEQ